LMIHAIMTASDTFYHLGKFFPIELRHHFISFPAKSKLTPP